TRLDEFFQIQKEEFNDHEIAELTQKKNELLFEQKAKLSLKYAFRSSFLIHYMTGLVSRISDSMMILVFPLLVIEYKYNFTQLGILTGSFTLFWSIGILITGPLSDAIGRKSPIIMGLFIEAIGFILIFNLNFISWFPLILFAISLSGLGRGIYFPISPSVITDIVPSHHRGIILGFYRFILDMGYLLGCLIIVILVEGRNTIIVNKIKLFEPIIFFVVLLILIQLFVIVIIFNDTRPNYRQLEHITQHLNYIQKSSIEVSKGIQAFEVANILKSKQFLENAKLFERKADKILDFMKEATFSGAFEANDATELLEFSRKIDKAAGHHLRSLRKLLFIKNQLKPEFYQLLRKYSIVLQLLVQVTVDIVTLIPIKINLAAEFSYHINYIEEYLDKLHRQMWEELMLHSTDLEPITIFLLLDIIDSLEKGSNTMEDATELIRLINFKRFPSTR
ncbi:MAG: MFS transporter, partial [Candidatus Heimdallarchaeota archaeon]|nr:MFS transporter [Candidatus Heimdallarchaeota archaeon]